MKKMIPTSDSLHQVAERLEFLLGNAADSIQKRETQAVDYLSRAHDALECLPLATDEFGLAKQRLRNCEKYFCDGELGASQYEIGLALNWLRNRAADLVS